MHIGLIGGIGPAATIAYYQRLVSSFAKAAVPLKLTITHADISVLTANASQDLRIQQAAVFSDHLSQLQAGGCDIALITALTGHFCFAETAVDSAVPLLNGIDVIDKHCRKQGIKRLGLLGSPPVLKTALFGMLTSPEAVRPTDPVNLGEAYMDVAMSGVCSDAQRALFFE
ncbi:MAG: aspartate/glutamate racemase family protein, partial [Pseudoruegeria sp.]